MQVYGEAINYRDARACTAHEGFKQENVTGGSFYSNEAEQEKVVNSGFSG